MRPQRTLPLLALLTTVMPSSAHAITYRSAWMDDWSGCECSEPGLSQTSDQIDLFNSRMDAHGHVGRGVLANKDVWASDLVEDRDFNGSDRLYSDDAEAYAYSGHGGVYTEPATGKQRFLAPMCKKGNAAYTGTCMYHSPDSRLGEQSWTYYGFPYAGFNRYMILATCQSVDTAPHQEWGPTMHEGTEFVMGYRGLSADSPTTDEVLGDWVDNAYDDTVYTFKSAWFNAIEDWWVDDTGAVVSGGTDSTMADWRRDNYSRTTARRGAAETWTQYSWSWHEG